MLILLQVAHVAQMLQILVCLDQDINLYFSQFGTVHFPYSIELTRNGTRGGNNGEGNQSGRTDEELNRGENTKGVNWEEETKSRNGKGKRSKMNRAEELTWNGARC